MVCVGLAVVAAGIDGVIEIVLFGLVAGYIYGGLEVELFGLGVEEIEF